jgi:hypothetical protein
MKKEMNLKLINTFPELYGLYHDEVDWQESDETGCHVVYGDVFEPYIEKLIIEKNNQLLIKVFAFLEELLDLQEVYIDEVIRLSVLEVLYDRKESIEYCKSFMKTKTLSMINKMIDSSNK